MIVLNKFNVSTNGLCKYFQIKTLKEKTTSIAKNFWLKNEYIRDFCFNYIHFINHH